MAATSPDPTAAAVPVRVALRELPELVGRLRLVSPPLAVTREMVARHPAFVGRPRSCDAETVPALVLLSLTTTLLQRTVAVEGVERAINYGVDDVRIGEPCPAGAEVVMDLALERVVGSANGLTASWVWLIAHPGGRAPLLQGVSLSRYVPAPG